MATKRLIDANELKRLTCEWCNKTRPEEPCEPSECSIMWFYDGQPTVDAVEVVHGRWIWHNKRELFEFKYECSICHDGSDLESNYCPNCGADMRGNVDG